MRTGADYKAGIKDGRKVWVLGEGTIDDLTTHPATSAMVAEYADWYDRHMDPEWQDVLMTPPDATGKREPLQLMIPRNADDLTRMGRAFSQTLLFSGGNVTHDPAYGNLIALGIHNVTLQHGVSKEQQENIAAYRDLLAETGRFLTFSAGAATIGYRFREDPAERHALRIVRETDGGLVLAGKVGMHTSPPFADDVYIGARSGVEYQDNKASFIVPINSPGVTVVSRKIAPRHENRFVAPMSSRFDELDGQLWLNEVFVPWERIFFTEAAGAITDESMRGSIAVWLFWHQIYCWFEKAEFTLGVALACADAMGLRQHQPTLDYIIDLVIEVQTMRSAITAAELDHVWSEAGYALPNNLHMVSAAVSMLRARQRITEILRILPGSSIIVAPSDRDLADPTMAAGLEESFGGAGYTALQRAALLNLAWDHAASGLDGRESAFELHASGGMLAWRNRARLWFTRYNDLASAALRVLDTEMPEIDVSGIGRFVVPPRREVSRPAAPANPSHSETTEPVRAARTSTSS